MEQTVQIQPMASSAAAFSLAALRLRAAFGLAATRLFAATSFFAAFRLWAAFGLAATRFFAATRLFAAFRLRAALGLAALGLAALRLWAALGLRATLGLTTLRLGTTAIEQATQIQSVASGSAASLFRATASAVVENDYFAIKVHQAGCGEFVGASGRGASEVQQTNCQHRG